MSGNALARYQVRFFHEWGAPGVLWSVNDAARDAFGYEIDCDALPLPKETKAEIRRVAQWHDTALNWDYPPDPGPWRSDECARFATTVDELLERLRGELGDEWEVRDTFLRPTEDEDLDAYLADPKGFRRDT